MEGIVFRNATITNVSPATAAEAANLTAALPCARSATVAAIAFRGVEQGEIVVMASAATMPNAKAAWMEVANLTAQRANLVAMGHAVHRVHPVVTGHAATPIIVKVAWMENAKFAVVTPISFAIIINASIPPGQSQVGFLLILGVCRHVTAGCLVTVMMVLVIQMIMVIVYQSAVLKGMEQVDYSVVLIIFSTMGTV